MRIKISVFYLLLYLGMGAVSPFMSLFLDEQGFNGSEIGIILAAGSLTGIVAQPIFGLINDASKDYRTLLKVSTLLSAFAVFGFFFSHSFWPIIVTAIIFSFINTPTAPIVDAFAVEKAPAFGFSYGQVRVWGAIGFALITVIAGYALSSVGYKYMFLAYAFFAIFMFAMIFSFPRIDRPKRPSVFGREVLGAVFTNWRFVLFVAICLLISISVTMNFSYLPIYFQKLHYPVDLVGWNFTIAAVVEIPLFLFSTYVIRRIGLFPMLAIGTCAYAVKYTVMGFTPPLGAVLALQALDGVAFAFYFTAAVEIVNRMAPDNGKATAQSVFAAAGGIAGIAANAAGGAIIDTQGPQFLFLLMGGISFFATLLFILFPRKHVQRDTDYAITGSNG
ncbi:MFS transporter [Paenibacillus thermotolerans]|uniref:MFS transporter n=1 Tax=Paenibacillus thermotolerans TaxID=3027807 RepID=UPI002367B1B4|nr:MULTISPECIES: MFS transporter [unclassified Paenibacillus]